ncbi:phage major capsid protein [Escherichia coli]|uniref:phage major capsid protein n=1 Tax=Escherichia coli TaxID=562 RepID=UPI000DA428A8|nr:phage major capsid protein [Escherichia coli]SQJ98664.1 phage major capsid protein, HK97 family [Escherichia coli]SQN76576.1 phage major capsid protein, HK97 family [Escherichia coli]SQQ68957.1 phage major capsid protein, HK97 family [Escherichia coli]HCO5676665.1 phage major capsid protein [Escherichia coli]
MLKFRRDLNGYGGVINEGQNDQYEFEIAFSSTQPYQRQFWDEQNQEMVVLDEILVHTPEAVDLSRLNNNAPLLFNHNFDNHIGVVCNARIDADNVGRALVKFSKHGTLANDIRNKVIEGTMEKISVGYDIKEYHIDYAKSQLIVSKWIPHEISWVTVPADDSVGLNRSLNTITVNLGAKRDMTKEQIEEIKEEQESAQVEETPVEENKESEVEETQERQVEENEENENLEDGKDAEHPESVDDDSSTVREAEEVKEEREAAPVEEEKTEEVAERSEEDEEEIRAIARELNIDDEELKRALAIKDMTPEAFRTKALNNITNSQRNNEQIKDSKMEKTFDLNNVIRSLVDGEALGANEAEFSAMAATATMQRGRAARGGSVFVPAAAMRAAAAGNTKADLTAITDEKLMTESYIEMLMPESVLGRLGVTVYSGLNAPTAIPKMTKSSVDAFGFVDENGAAPESKAEFANVKLSPKTFAGGNPISRQSLKTVPGIATLITDHINKAVRIKLEQLILSDKANDRGPAGLVKQLVDGGRVEKKAAFSYKDFLKEIAKLTDAGVPAQAIKFAMSGATAAELESTLKDNGVSGYIIENGKLAGYEVVTSGVIPADHIVLGDFSGITIGEWGGLELDMDDTTYRAQSAIVPRIWVDLDYVVTQPEALKVLKMGEE